MKMEFVIEKPDILKKSQIFITGFHGLGEVGYIAIRHIIDQLNCERTGIIISDSAPPVLSIYKGKLQQPFEFYTYENFTFMIPHLQPYQHLQSLFATKLVDWLLSQNHFTETYLLGGVDARLRISEDFNLRYIPTQQYMETITQERKELIEKNLLDEGLFVAGPLAVILGILDIKEHPALAVLAYAQRDRPDPKGAVYIVEELNKMFDLTVDTTELIENAKRIEEEIQKHLDDMQLTTRGDKTAGMYT